MLNLSLSLLHLYFHIRWSHRIYFTYNPTASFFMHRVVDLPTLDQIQNETHATQDIQDIPCYSYFLFLLNRNLLKDVKEQRVLETHEESY